MREIRQTHTFATLELSKKSFQEIYKKLLQANYQHCFIETEDDLVIDMNGIGIKEGKNDD